MSFRTLFSSTTSSPPPSAAGRIDARPVLTVDRRLQGRRETSPLENPFAQASSHEVFGTSDASTLLISVHKMLEAAVTLLSDKVTEVKEIENQVKSLLLPLLSFGENSPYNEDANKVAKTLLSKFKLFPSDEELLGAAPLAFAPLLNIETNKGTFKSYVSPFEKPLSGNGT